MSKYIKWLGAGLGFTLGGPIGAILGYALGSVVDSAAIEDFNQGRVDYDEEQDQRSRVHATPGDFEISLLILASVVIKADGKIEKSELDYVRLYFVRTYGKDKANNLFKLFNGIVKKKVSTRQVAIQIREHMKHASRLQLIHFLFGIAKADGVVTSEEEKEIHKISNYFYINEPDYVSIKAMFFDEVDGAYKILEISKDVSNDEIKKAYRRMAKKHHPDRLQNIGEQHKEGVTEKFQQIQEAYERLKKERDM